MVVLVATIPESLYFFTNLTISSKNPSPSSGAILTKRGFSEVPFSTDFCLLISQQFFIMESKFFDS